MAAVVALALLPAVHVHDDEGTARVHRHVIDHDDDHGHSAVDHEDHLSVRTLAQTIDVQRQYDVAQPLTLAEPVVAASDRRFAGRVHRLGAPLAHGPPIRIRSLRAPPA